jgi:predicted dinucleotide-binding enzyme
MSRDAAKPFGKTARAALTAGGLRAIDAGSLRRARELEAMGSAGCIQAILCSAERPSTADSSG